MGACVVGKGGVSYFALPRLHYDPLAHGAQCHKTIVGPFSMQGYQALF